MVLSSKVLKKGRQVILLGNLWLSNGLVLKVVPLVQWGLGNVAKNYLGDEIQV